MVWGICNGGNVQPSHDGDNDNDDGDVDDDNDDDDDNRYALAIVSCKYMKQKVV